VSPRVNFRTSHALHERARRRAEDEGKTVSQVARDALEKYVA
jgi:predicted HicB family RNase H-like nuclease